MNELIIITGKLFKDLWYTIINYNNHTMIFII